jgi:hypothetical protein
MTRRRAERVARLRTTVARVDPASVEDRPLASGVLPGGPFDAEDVEEEGLLALPATIVEGPDADRFACATGGEAPRSRHLSVVAASPGRAVLGEEVDGDRPVRGLRQAKIESRVATLDHLVVADGQEWSCRSKAACSGQVDDGRPHASLGSEGVLDSRRARRDRGRGHLRQARGDQAGHNQPTGASSTAQVPTERFGERPAEIQACYAHDWPSRSLAPNVPILERSLKIQKARTGQPDGVMDRGRTESGCVRSSRGSSLPCSRGSGSRRGSSPSTAGARPRRSSTSERA